MRATGKFFKRLHSDDRGAAIIEFAFVAGPMVLLLLGGLELGYNSYVRSTMQGALNDAARPYNRSTRRTEGRSKSHTEELFRLFGHRQSRKAHDRS